MKYLKVFETFNKSVQDTPQKKFVDVTNKGEDIMNYTDSNKYFDVVYPEVILALSPNQKPTIKLSEKEIPLAANGAQMKGVEFSYDALVEVKTSTGVLSIYFGTKGGPPDGRPIPDFVEFKKVYNNTETLQNDVEQLRTISQTKKGSFEITLPDTENGWALRLNKLNTKTSETNYRQAEILTSNLIKAFR